MGTTNQINANAAGIVTYDGAGNFSADTTTAHNVLVGATSNGITNIAPSASGTVLASNGVSADPSFQSVPGVGVTVTQHDVLVGGASNSITSVSPSTSGFVLTSNGVSADPSFQALPAATGVQTLTDGSANVVSPSGGTITFTNGNNISNLSGSANHITFSVSGTTNHSVQVGNSSGSLTSLGLGTAGQALVSGGASSDPSFGTLPVNGGGTGATTLTGILTGNGTSAVTASAVSQYTTLVAGASNAVVAVGPGSSGQVLASNGASANPSYQSIPGVGTTVTNHYVLVGAASNGITSVSPSTAGYVLTSNGTSLDPSFQALPPSGFTWVSVAGTSQSMSPNNAYVNQNSSLTTFTLPATAAFGDTYIISGVGTGGWKIVENSGQQILIGNGNTTTTTGSIASTVKTDSIQIVCVTANTLFKAVFWTGNLTVV